MRLDQITQSFIQPGLENLNEWILNNLSGKPLTVLDTFHSQKVFS